MAWGGGWGGGGDPGPHTRPPPGARPRVAALAARAQQVVVVADASKLGRRAFARIIGTDQVHTLITDDAADPDVLAAVRAAGVEVQLV